ncbi:MAG TPA: hypothetical protein DEQ32_06195 [Gammaproteobacteria bacterium]|nr:hypothetical protein [Gammaproteobacteria bacterium]
MPANRIFDEHNCQGAKSTRLADQLSNH